jgi:O-antigen/teichoic acid export membrane protein
MQSSLMLALFAICSRLGARWQAFVGANAVAGIITLIALAVLARRQLPPSASELSNKRLMGTARTVAAASFGLGLASILSAVYYKVDALLVFRLAGSVQAGLYGAAYRFYELALIVPTAVNLSALAGAARRIHGGDDDARPYVSAVFVALLVAGVGGAVLFLLAGRPLVELVFGSEFTAAVPMLQVLAFGLLARFVHVWLGSILIAVERRKRFTAVVAVTAVVAIVADLIAIPRFGGLGAAWVTVAVETLMVVGTLLMLPEDLRPHVHRGVRYLGRAIGWTR